MWRKFVKLYRLIRDPKACGARAEKLTPEERIQRGLPLLGITDAETAELIAIARREVSIDVADFEKLQAYCMFIGYPRSGHSLVGSLLDAHPNIIIAHELNALQFIVAGCTGRELFHLLLRNSREFAALGRRQGKYDYTVPGQWQGRYGELRVIGDKKGGTSTILIGKSPDLLDRLEATVPLPKRFIHIIRNPYDNIATIAQKNTHDLSEAVNDYFSLCRINQEIMTRVGRDSVLTLRHEDIISDPAGRLRKLAAFLGVPADETWSSACTAIVAKKPRQSRREFSWTARLCNEVQSQIAGFDFLSGYCYDDVMSPAAVRPL